MSKYRFKKREEFIRDGLWDERYNCPDEWAWEGQMNKYLGIDVPDEFNIHCDENEDFQYDGWYFQNTNYVLKEQQKYFDDLSQHIGRYIKALVDNPHSGIGVEKGDVGKIFSSSKVVFPNSKNYSCSNALSEGTLGIKYELLPEDYSPEQEVKEPSIEFIPGKWYKFLKGNFKFGKYEKIHNSGNRIKFSEIITSTGIYDNKSTHIDFTSDIKLLEDLSEIQKYLPNGHLDKVGSFNFEVGKWYSFNWDYFGKDRIIIAKIKVVKEDQFNISWRSYLWLDKSYSDNDAYFFKDISNIKELSIKEIQPYLPKEHPDKIFDKVECTEFKKGEYIVILDKFESLSKDFISNHIYKQRKDSTYLQPEYDSSDSITNGWVKYTRNNTHNWRYATQEEINEYERRGKPYDVTELQKKELSMKEIQEECKKRFPIGCTYISTDGIKYVLKDSSGTYSIFGDSIWAHSGGALLYAEGKYAELVSLPEENITEVPKYVKCNHYFGNEYIGKIYDTSIDKPEKMSSNTWHEILITCGRLEDESFEISNKEDYEKQKSHIPEYIECTETQESYFIKGNIYKVIASSNLASARLISNIELSQISAGTSLFCSMEIDGKKYWKPSTKEKYDQQKTLTYESVSGCFPTDKKMFIFDEVGQFPSTFSDYWKNVSIFVEKEFDIYGPTPDIE